MKDMFPIINSLGLSGDLEVAVHRHQGIGFSYFVFREPGNVLNFLVMNISDATLYNMYKALQQAEKEGYFASKSVPRETVVPSDAVDTTAQA